MPRKREETITPKYGVLGPEEARWRLARVIYETIEGLDPSRASSFAELTDYERGLYYEVVMTLLDYADVFAQCRGSEASQTTT